MTLSTFACSSPWFGLLERVVSMDGVGSSKSPVFKITVPSHSLPSKGRDCGELGESHFFTKKRIAGSKM
jgi:hypothetical protein